MTSPISVDNSRDASSTSNTQLRGQRPVGRRIVVAASPAAVDEVFANLARREATRRADASSSTRPHHAAQINQATFGDEHLHDLAVEMNRQQERLAQLLRDIDG
jgi:hypothetical protein